jgi:alpha/beta superfamily hydrolase
VIFLPDKLSADYGFRFGEEVYVEVDEGVKLHCLWDKNNSSKGVILYFHGNKGSNARCQRQAETMMGLGYDIFMPDYRGYGKSDGSIHSQEQLLNDAQQVYDYVKTQYPEDKIVLVGYSLGTGIASYIASKNNPQQVFLNSPYISFTDLKDRRIPFIPDFLVKYPLDNYQFLQLVDEQVTIFHGTEDELIPFDSSEKLHSIDVSRIHLIPLQNSGHRRAIFHSTFSNGMAKFLL